MTRALYKKNPQIRAKRYKMSRDWAKENKERYAFLSWRAGLLKLYGCTVRKYVEMFMSQNGRCAICGRRASALPKGLDVDHDHTTKEIRGLLCGDCNRGLGMFRDSKVHLNNAILYLNNVLRP